MALRRAPLTIAAVVAATLAGGYLALVSYSQDRALSVGEIRQSVSPGHKGALDVYVPLVDWGARFEAIRLPARLRVDLRTVDRDALQRLADGGALDVADVRGEARDAIASYLRTLIAVVGLRARARPADRVRGPPPGGPRLRYTRRDRRRTALGHRVALVVLIPPRGEIDDAAVLRLRRRHPARARRRRGRAPLERRLDQELDAQLVGLARLVTAPAGRTPSRAARDHGRLRPAQQLRSRSRSSSARPGTGRCSSRAT